MVKKEIDSKEYLRAEMWCHFGTGMIRGANRGRLQRFLPSLDYDNFFFFFMS